MDKPIKYFRGPYRFLSNFYDAGVLYDGYKYPTVEHAFQASKCLDGDPIIHRINTVKSPATAKRLGRNAQLRGDWEQVKYDIMWELVLQKFARHFDIRALLLETNDALLVEGNAHGDTYWGMCGGEGENKLGIILMGVRKLLRCPHCHV